MWPKVQILPGVQTRIGENVSSSFNHGVQGGFILGYPFVLLFKIIGWLPIYGFACILFGIGAIIGTLPDALTLFGVYKPDTHDKDGKYNKKWKWIPSWWLHTWQDIFWHSYPDHHPIKDWGEILSIVLSIVMLYLMFIAVI